MMKCQGLGVGFLHVHYVFSRPDVRCKAQEMQIDGTALLSDLFQELGPVGMKRRRRTSFLRYT